MITVACHLASSTIDDTHCVEFLPDLVEGTKKYMHVASQDDIRKLIKDVDDLIGGLEGLEQSEGAVNAMKELKGMAKDMPDKFS
ncbi:hypothetical protein BDR04DRAFT_1094387, partial [Suillus decipiens]